MLTFRGDDHGLRTRLERLHDAMTDLSPVWPNVESIFGDFIQKQFESQGGYTGTTWVPLNPSYAEWKSRHYGGKGMMHLTERLYPSLRFPAHEEHVHYEGPNFVEMGTRVPYAKAHQYGRPDIKLPRRQVLPRFTSAEGKRIVDVILAYLFRRMRGGIGRG